MKLWKRAASLLLVLVLVVGLIPVPAQAAGKQTAAMDSGDITATGTNGLGVLVSEEINDRQTVEEAETSGRFTVSGLEVAGNTAIVEYGSLEDAIALVAIYTEDGKQMLLSGTAPARSGQGKVQVKLEDTMPEYFMAMAYLVDVYDYSPLCPAYETPMYTREMQALKASTTEDYAPDTVLNLDDSKKTNFAVYAPGTIVIDEKPGENIVAKADDGNAVYVIEQADAAVRGLKVGDVVVYPYGEGNILVTKVGKIKISGTTVTITGSDVELEEAFSQLKLESENGTQDVTVDDSTASPEVRYDGMAPAGPAAKAIDGELTQEAKMKFFLGAEGKTSGETAGWSFKGTVDVQMKISFGYYLSLKRQFVEFKLDHSETFGIELKGSLQAGKFSLGNWGLQPVPCVGFGFEPVFVVEFEAALKGSITTASTIGFSLEHEDQFKWQNLSTPAQTDYTIEAKGTVFIGIDFGPTISVANDSLIKLKLSTKAGVEYEGVQLLLDEELRRGEKKHDCKACIDITMTEKKEVAVSYKILCFGGEYSICNSKAPLGHAYCSLTYGEFGLGACPHITYRTVVEVNNDQGLPAQGVDVIVRDGKEQEYRLGVTDAGGRVTKYLPVDSYTFMARVDDMDFMRSVELKEAQRVVLDSYSAKAKESFTTMIQGELENGKLEDSFEVASGEYGERFGTVHWTLYGSGLLKFTGQGRTAPGEKAPWNKYNIPIRQVVVEEGITNLHDSIFADHYDLQSVILPESLVEIGHWAFDGCHSLASVQLGKRVERIGASAFRGCRALGEIQLPESLTEIGESAFQDCVRLSEAAIPSGVKELRQDTFMGCTGLRSVRFAQGLEVVGANAFQDCALIAAVQLPQGLREVGEYAFNGCSALADIVLPNSVTVVGDNAFGNTAWYRDHKNSGPMYLGPCLYGWKGRAEKVLEIREGTKVLADGFLGWRDLAEVYLPGSLVTIGANAFQGCSKLTEIRLPAYLRSIRYGAFSETGLQRVVLPELLTDMGDYAFRNCAQLTEIELPVGIKQLGEGVFQDSGWYNAQPDGPVYLGACLLGYKGNVDLGKLEVKAGTRLIADRAFAGESSLTGVVLPRGLETIGQGAFSDCRFTEGVTLPEGLRYIGGSAFDYCGGGQKLTIPASVEEMGERAFGFWNDLQQVVFAGSAPRMGGLVFEARGYHPVDYYYPQGDASWTEAMRQGYGREYFEWVPYATGTMAASARSVGEKVRLDAPKRGSVDTFDIFDGEYGTEIVEGQMIKKATFRGLTPGQEYLLLAMVDARAAEPLAAENLLYVRQGQAAEDGTLSFTYIQRTPADVSYVMACGAANKHLRNAIITLPKMEALEGVCQQVKPVVVYDGKTLREGWDYTVSGQVDFTAAGEYVCFIRGIREYTGLMKCVYTVVEPGKLEAPMLEVKSDWDSGRPHLTWTAVEGATGYEVWGAEFPQEKVLIATTEKLEMMDLETVVGEEYRYEVRAVNGTVKGAFSQEAGDYCRCARPVITGEVDEKGQPMLQWKAVDGAVGYEIGRGDQGPSQHIAKVQGLEFVDTTAEKGKNYHYQVRALGPDGFGDSVWSRAVELSTRMLKAPVVQAYTDGVTGGPYLAWDGVDGAASYEIWRAARGEKLALLETITGTRYTDTAAKPGVAYHYQVRAVSEAEKSDFSKDVVRWGTCAMPQLTLTTRSDGKPVLSWQAVEGAVRYTVSYSDNGGGFETLKEVSGTTLTHSSAKPGHTYTYMVQAVCGVEGCSSIWSEDVSITMPEEVALGVPEVKVSNVAATGKLYIQWNKVEGAAKYEVWRAASRDGSYSRIYATASGDHVINGKAVAGTTYYYKVRAIGADGTEGAFSAVKYRTCDLSQPQVTLSRRSDGKPVLSWQAVDGAVKYEVWRSADGGGFSRLSSPTGTRLTNSSAQAGHTYAYRVRAICAKSAGNSAYSDVLEVTLEAQALDVPEVKVSNVASTGKLYIQWNKVDGAAKYEVWRATSKSGTYSRIYTTSGDHVTNGRTTAGRTYYYKVRSIGADGTVGAFSAVKYRTCDCARPDVKLTVRSDGKPVLSWQKVDGAVKYEVYRSVNGGSFSRLSTITGTKLTNSSVKRGNTYRYKVRAICSRSAGNSAWSYYDSVKVK